MPSVIVDFQSISSKLYFQFSFENSESQVILVKNEGILSKISLYVAVPDYPKLILQINLISTLKSVNF